MTKEDMAAVLNGREAGKEVTRDDEIVAKANGLLIVFGGSDDLIELRGVVDDEVGCRNGGTATVSRSGRVVQPIEKDDREILLKHGVLDVVEKSLNDAVRIEAIWDRPGGPVWSYKTLEPHATFDIMEDGDVWCRGIVVDLKANPHAVESRGHEECRTIGR